jgi:hypothetical protein
MGMEIPKCNESSEVIKESQASKFKLPTQDDDDMQKYGVADRGCGFRHRLMVEARA